MIPRKQPLSLSNWINPDLVFHVNDSIGAWLPLIYLMLALPSIVLFAFVTPPMNVPDEACHFMKAVQVSEGHFSATHLDPGHLGGWFSGNVASFASSSLFAWGPNSQIHRFIDGSQAERDRVRDLSWEGQGPQVYANLPTTVFNPVTSYAPAALGLFISRHMGFTLLESFYIGRLANGIFSILVCSFAIYLCQRMRLLFVCVLCLPMTLFLQSSYSQDAIIIDACALVVGLMCRKEAPSSSLFHLGLIGFLMFCIVAAKLFYAPLYILTYRPQKGGNNYRWVLIMGISLALVLLHEASLPGIVQVYSGTSNPPEQIAYLTQSPFHIIEPCLNTLRNQGVLFVEQTMGILGYMEIQLPNSIYILCACSLIVAITSGFLEFSNVQNLRYLFQSGISLAVLAGIGFSILAIEYVIWSVPRGDLIDGIQGRYFLPLLVFSVVALGNCATFTPVLSRFRMWFKAGGVAFCVLTSLTVLSCSMVRIITSWYY